jgi:hypothetical protein
LSLEELEARRAEILDELGMSARRFFCPVAACPKVTFAEQVSGLTSRHARRTTGLTSVCRRSR